MSAAEVLWRPHAGPQERFMRSAADDALYGGAAGGGKTDALIWDQGAETEHPAFRGLFLRATFPQLREVMDRMHGWFPKLGATWSASEKRWEFPGGSTLMVGFGSTFEELQQYSGFEFTAIAYDEVGNLADEKSYTFLGSRLRSTYDGPMGLPFLRQRGSANPGQKGHAWIKRRYILPCPRDGSPVAMVDAETGLVTTRAFFAARVEDNPRLMRDPRYIARLNALPELLRRQLREGDWSAGAGMALSELHEQVHIVPPFAAPPHWTRFGAFDWGFRHPFAFGRFAADEDGSVYLLNSVHGRQLQPDQIAARIVEATENDRWNPDPGLRFSHISAGHDCFQEHKARGENTPMISEHFAAAGLYLTPANIARVAGLNNMREYVQWRRPDPTDLARTIDTTPRFHILDTPANRHTYEVLSSVVEDPHHPEDALKVDADEDGEGGDDAYDMVRYGLASRPLRAVKQLPPAKGAWHPDVLAAEARERRTVRTRALVNPVELLRLEAEAGW